MKRHWVIGALGMGLGLGFAGCGSDDPERIEPAVRGQRGESCRARNDCQSGLACIAGFCSQNDFPIDVVAKHCDRVQCAEDADCCGNKPLEAPPECADYTTICNSLLPGCPGSVSCSDDSSCGSGVCGAGFCSTLGTACTSAADCLDDCVNGVCTLSSLTCSTVADCYGAGTCTSRFCQCANPSYDPTNPICGDTTCFDICLLRCEDELCVQDTSCDTDADCNVPPALTCNEGICVECVDDSQCDTDAEETCSPQGLCRRPCRYNEECPFFHQCQDGECVATGCSSDRECVLAANQTGGGDGRLLKCLPSDTNPDVRTCKVPCENDGACSQFEVCENGFCKFVGCESNDECRGYLNIQNERPTDARPYVTQAVCRE